MILLGKGAQVEAQFAFIWRSVLILMQDTCMNCMERTICFKYIWTHPIELLDDVCHIESQFDLFGDSVCFGAR